MQQGEFTLHTLTHDVCRAQDDFSSLKLNLIDKETKKRMLEELWHDRVELPVEEAKAAEREMQVKKAAVEQLKKANQQRREGIRKQALAIDAGVTRLHEHEASTTSVLQQAVAANTDADEQRAKTSVHAGAAQRARTQTTEMGTVFEAAKAECEALTQRLAALHRQTVEAGLKTDSLRTEGDGVAARLTAQAAHTEIAAAVTSERSGWYATVNAVVQTLAGIPSVSTSGADTIRYELSSTQRSCGYGGHGEEGRTVALYVQLDPLHGDLVGVRLEPPGLADVTDLIEAAVRLNSVEMLLREVQARLEPPPGTEVASSVALVPAIPSTRRRGGLALTPTGRGECLTQSNSALLHEEPPLGLSNTAAQLPAATSVPPTTFTQPPAARALSSSMAAAPLSSCELGTWTHGSAAVAPLGRAIENLNSCSSITVDTPASSARSHTRVLETTDTHSTSAVSLGYDPLANSLLGAMPRSAHRMASVAAASTSAGGALCTTLGMPISMRVENVDASALCAIGAARHDASCRKPRKSFSRSVAHPRSPCSRAARAGFMIDPKVAISEVVGTDGFTGGATREFLTTDPVGNAVGSLMSDGSVLDARGELRAYIEADGTVGAPNLDYLGEVTAPNDSSKGFVTNADDELIAEVDYGLGVIRDATGSTVASLTRNGEISGHHGARAGRLEGFTYMMMRSAAAYLTLVEPALLEGK